MSIRLSEEANIIKVYNYLVTTGEFIGESDAYIPTGTGLPANSTDIAPPKAKKGNTVIFHDGVWLQTSDYRGMTVYSISTGQPSIYSDIGELSQDYTFLEPNSQFDEWNGVEWVKNTEREKECIIAANENKKASLLSVANSEITVLSDAVEFDIATDDDVRLLPLWRKYRVLLTRIDTNQVVDITWPEVPA